MQRIIQNLYQIGVFKRLIPSLLKFYIKIFKKNKQIIKFENISLTLNLFNPIDREIFLKGKYENEQLKYLMKNIRTNEIKYFFDIGAHMGFYSMIVSKEKLKVYSFEPIKNNFDQLDENKKLNNFENLTIYNFALSNSEKDIEMWVPNKDKTGGYSVYDNSDEELKKYDQQKINLLKSKTKIGDNLFKLKKEKIAIKIDVERHELQVLMGLKQLLTNNNIFLQVELFKGREDKIFYYLKNINFEHINTIEKDYYFKNF